MALLGAAPLRVVDPLLGWVDVDQAPADGTSEHLPQRLGRLEAVSARDRHPPGGDLRRLELVDPPLAKRAHRLREQPAQLLHSLGLAGVLGGIHVDEITELRCLDQTALATKPLERSLERLIRRLLGPVATALHALRTPTADAIAIRPFRAAVRFECEDLSLLKHPPSPPSFVSSPTPNRVNAPPQAARRPRPSTRSTRRAAPRGRCRRRSARPDSLQVCARMPTNR
jgi:hypothetical protein